MKPPPGRKSGERRRDDEDTAVVLTIASALASVTAAAVDPAIPAAPTVWGDPAHRLGVGGPAVTGWWASGMPR